MNVAEWIIVVILSVTLFIFLIVGIILIIKLIGLTKEAKKVVETKTKKNENANPTKKRITEIGTMIPKTNLSAAVNAGKKNLQA